MVNFSRSEKISVGCHRAAVCGPCCTVWTHSHDKGEIYRAQVCMWYHVVVGDSLSSHKSKPQLLKRNWSKDMTQNVRCAAKSEKRLSAAKGARKRAGENFGLTPFPPCAEYSE